MANHEQHFTEEQLTESFSFDGKLRRNIFITMGVGLFLLIVGFFTYHPSHHGDHDDHGDHGHHSQIEQVAPSSIHKVQDDHGEGDHHEGEHGDHAEGAHGDHGAHGEHHNHALPHHKVDKFAGFMAALMQGGLFWFIIAMGSFFFIAVHRLGNAGWQTAIKRVPEAMASYISVAVIVLLLIAVLAVIFKVPYDWMAIPEGQDAIIDSKRGFLNIPFWLIRSVIFFGGWYFLINKLRKLSVEADNMSEAGGLANWEKMLPYAAGSIVFFGLSYVMMFTVDWVKSLEPHWFSTMFGVYWFAGTMATTMAVMGLIVNFLRKRGYMAYVSDSHVHDIYKYAFGFSVFWGYIFVSQYLLIWYANIPEETIYFYKRIHFLSDVNPWLVDQANMYLGYGGFFWTTVFLCFATPFLGLMTRNAKRFSNWFTIIAVLMIIGHWMDVAQMIMPGIVGHINDVPWLLSIGMTLILGGAFAYVVFTSLSKANLVAKRHPYLDESIHHTTGPV
ncbi:MAG: hypothetical protein AB8F95_22005 [Bacteroidia bacterium]